MNNFAINTKNYVNYPKIMELKKFFFNDNEVKTLENDLSDIDKILKKQKPIKTENKKTTVERKTFSIQEAGDIWMNIYGEKFVNVKCHICDAKFISFHERSSWHVSHIKSLHEGGTNDVSNLRPLCKTCNLSMKTKNLIEYCRDKYKERMPEITKALKLTGLY